jgi:hypothetical protein
MTANTPEHEDAGDRAAKIIADALAHGLVEAEAFLAAERERKAQAVSPQLLETLERFGQAMTRLAEFTELMGARMNELTEAVTQLAATRDARPPAGTTPQLPDMEPSFPSGGEGIDVTIAAVPGFQGLMDLQRALVRMPNVQSAAVRRYQDDEAAIQLVLAQPMTAGAIVHAVIEATGSQIVIDEVRIDVLRLRLRFLGE